MNEHDALYQCVPNFSEGQRLEVVEALAQSIRDTPGARLIDYSADPDHNRCVLTFLGNATAVRAAALSAARTAVTRIDMLRHQGIHPRAGAMDVLPVVPLRHAGRETAVALARAIGFELAAELDLPVYFYEWAAFPGRRTALPELRRGGFEAFASAPLVGDRAPDAGPPAIHPSAGICVVGARAPLVAYNIFLDTADVGIARALARRVRRERASVPALEGVRALGLYLASRHCAQLSFNITRPEATSLPAVYAWVQAAAADAGVRALESEIIGVLPASALAGESPEAIRWATYRPEQILDTWLDS